MKGRKAIPSAMKVLRGTDQPVRMPEQENAPARVEKLPPAPKWFSALAKKIYKTKGQELINQNVIATVDLDMFLLYCNEYAAYIESSEELRKWKMTDNLGEDAMKRYKRLVQINKQAWERSKSIAIEFGFTPSARSRVSPLKGEKQLSEFEKMMGGL